MSLPISQVTDHVDTALAQQLGQFLASPRLRELTDIIVDEVQRLEDLIWEITNEILLDNAEGVQLDDVYGKIVGVIRLSGESDSDYRQIIRVAILANNSTGHPDVVARVVGQGTGLDVQYEQVGHAHFALHVESSGGISTTHWDRLSELLARAAPLGVSWRVLEGSASAAPGNSRYNSGRYNSAVYGRIVGKSEDH
jgi:hypothetical protein